MSPLFALLGQEPKGLLFDLDGTLLDSVPDLAAAVDEMLKAAGLPLAGEPKVRDWVGNGSKILVERALAFTYQCDIEELDRAELLYQHQQFLLFYRECSSHQSKLYPGVVAALQHWQQQGISMAVVTNKPAEFVLPLLQRFEIQHYFSVWVGGDTLAQRKPSPEPLLYACEQLGVAADQCIMIGDSTTDIAAACAANMPVACVSYGYNHGEPIVQAGPDLVVDGLLELIA